MKVRDFMNDEIHVVLVDDTLRMTENLVQSDLANPVLVSSKYGNKLVGVITSQDVQRLKEQGRNLESTSAEEVMRKDPITVRTSDSIIEVWQKMLLHDLDSIPVVSTGGKAEGVITRARLQEVMPNAKLEANAKQGMTAS